MCVGCDEHSGDISHHYYLIFLPGRKKGKASIRQEHRTILESVERMAVQIQKIKNNGIPFMIKVSHPRGRNESSLSHLLDSASCLDFDRRT